MEFSNEGWKHVRGRQVEVVARPVEVRRHSRNEIAAVLSTVRFAQFDSSNLRQRIPLVCGFEWPGQQLVLRDRLRRLPGIDTRRSEIKKLRDAHQMRRVHNSSVNHQIVVDELSRPTAIRQNSADRAGDEKHVVGLVRLEPVVHLRLVAKVKLTARCGKNGAKARPFKTSEHGAPYKAAMASDENPGIS
jgi:hypothetical protein